MDARQRLLISETDLQCGFGLAAYRDAASAVQHRDPADFWRHMQSLLTAALHLRQLLVREAGLRATLGIPSDSAILNPDLEAVADPGRVFDVWVRAHPRGPLRLTNFGPLGISHADPAVFARYFDAESSTLLLYGTTFHLPDLLIAMAAVKAEAASQLRQIQALV